MSDEFGSMVRRVCWMAAMGMPALITAAPAQSVCMSTPVAAMRSAQIKSSILPGAESSGYRVTRVRWDPLLQQSWATIVSCGHPEWPGLSIRVLETNAASQGLTAEVREEHLLDIPVIHAGDIVHLWRQEELLRIEVTGVAEESGGLGKMIRVRLLRRGAADQATEEEFTGIVRGPSDVEMEP